MQVLLWLSKDLWRGVTLLKSYDTCQGSSRRTRTPLQRAAHLLWPGLPVTASTHNSGLARAEFIRLLTSLS